jgi:phage terminase large subunit-like protein
MPYVHERADRVVDFFRKYLVHTKGEWAGKPFVLEPWQENDIIRPLFGTVDAPAGFPYTDAEWLALADDSPERAEWLPILLDQPRTFRRAFIEIPRKNGKSELAAGVACYLLFADGEVGGEVYGAAKDKDQAEIVFNVARDMVNASPALTRKALVVDSRKRIVHRTTRSVYRAIPADAAGSHGFNASGVVLDEVHTQPNRELYDVLTTSMGARKQPLVFAITTAGHDRNSLCYTLHDYALKVISGVIVDPTFFAYVMAAPETADWRDEAVWAACNPALGVFRGIEDMRVLAREAENMPAAENAFRNLYLNQWTSQAVRWLPLHKWDQGATPIDLEALRGRACYGGLDLASTTDIAALLLLFPPLAPGDTYTALARFWIPAENMRERVRRDRVPYDVWAKDARYVTATEGNVISYDAILAGIDELAQVYDIKEIGFDRWGATMLVQKLQDAGMTVVPIGQGFASMSPPTKELLNIVLDQRLQHGGHPVLRWMADNVVVELDPAGNIKPSKSKSSEKIDGIVALIMALDRATRSESTVSVYEERGILAF